MEQRGLSEPLALAWAKAFDQGLVKALANLGGQRHGLGIAENLDRLLRRIHHEAAIITVLEMALEVGAGVGIQLAIQIVRNFANDSSSFHTSTNFGCPHFSIWLWWTL